MVLRCSCHSNMLVALGRIEAAVLRAGLAMLLLLVAELCLGFVMYLGRRPRLKAAHIAIAIAVLVLLFVHFMVRSI